MKINHHLQNIISQDEVINLAKELIKIPSYPNITNQETLVAKYLHKLFLKEGIKSELKHVADGRYNILAWLNEEKEGKTILLTGHTDTVPPYDMVNPLEPYIKDGKLFGRGAVDMKGPLAAMVAAIIGIKRSGIKLNGKVVFAGTIDEECKSEGTIDLVESGIKADVAIVGEPTSMNICVAHRGLEWLEFEFQGKTVHGGNQSQGINAIVMATDFIKKVNEKLPKIIEQSTHEIIGRGSFNFGTIMGGTQPSTVAGNCRVTLDRRWLPGEKYENILNQFEQIIEELKYENSEFNCKMKVMDISKMREGYIHESMEIVLSHEIIDLVKKSTQAITGIDSKITYFPAWSDGGLISSYGNIPTIIWAPGDLESAHSAKEHIKVEQLYLGTLIYASIIENFCE